MSDVDPAYALATLAVAVCPAVLVLLLGASMEYALLTSVFVMSANQLLREGRE